MGKSAWDVRVKSEQTAYNNVITMTCSVAYHSRTVLPPREGGEGVARGVIIHRR